MPLTPRKIVLLLASTLTVMSGATIAASLPLIREAFADNERAEFLSKLVLTVPALLIAICSPIAGWLVDRFGRRNLLLLGLLLYACGGTFGGLVDDLYLILMSRALLGVAVALVMTTTTTLIADYFTDGERSDLLGKQGAAMAVGGIIFISGGGVLADLSWRAPFFIYLFSLVILPLAWKYLEEPDLTSGKEERKQQLAEPRSYIAPAILLFFVMFLTMVVFYMVPVQIPFLLNEFGTSATRVGLSIAASTLSGAIASLQFRRLSKLLNPMVLLAGAFAFIAAGYAVIGWADTPTLITVGLFIGGFGIGIIMPNVNLLMMAMVPAGMRGRMLGFLSAFTYLGQFLSPILLSPVIADYGLQSTFTYVAGLVGLVAVGFAVYSGIAPGDAQLKQRPVL